MDKDYLNITSKNILNDIKDKLERNNVILNEKEEKKTDEKMLEIIKSVLENDYKLLHKKLRKDEKINFSVMKSLIQYYMAIYNDNLNLLHKLLDDNFDWNCSTNYRMNLFVLDKRISSNFSEEEYLGILKTNVKLLDSFYSSLHDRKDDSKINADELINKACNILKKDKNVARTKNGELEYIFTADLLNSLNEDEMLSLSDEQKRILSFFSNDFDGDFKLKLIKNYNYSKNLIFWNEFEKYFTIDEILNLSNEEIEMYQDVINYRLDVGDYDIIVLNAIKKIKEIKGINPNFNYSLNAIVYDALSTKQIISLSEDAVDKINRRCWVYEHYGVEYDLNKNYLRSEIKTTRLIDSVKNKLKKITKK